jgi:hypothetical protein
LSGWLRSRCEGDAGCGEGGICVVAGEEVGGCAFSPPCVAGERDFESARFAGGDAVTVCAVDDGTCVDGFCAKNDDCNTNGVPCPDGFVCGEDGSCRCDGDVDCGGRTCVDGTCRCDDVTDCPSPFHCLPSGECGCFEDVECAGSGFGDVCVEGTCGCSSNAACQEGEVCAPRGTFDEDDVD